MRKWLFCLVALALLCAHYATAEETQFSVVGEWYVIEFDEDSAPFELNKTDHEYTVDPQLGIFLSCSVDMKTETITITSTIKHRHLERTEKVVGNFFQLSEDSWMYYTKDVSSLTGQEFVSGWYFEDVTDPLNPFDGTQIYEFSNELVPHKEYLLINGHIYPDYKQYDQYWLDGAKLYLLANDDYFSAELHTCHSDVFLLKSTHSLPDGASTLAGSLLFIRDVSSQ